MSVLTSATGPNGDYETSQRLVLNKGLAADEGVRWRKWPRIAIPTVDGYIGDDALQEASISLVNWRTDIERLAERVFAGAAVPTSDRHPSRLGMLAQSAGGSIV